MRWRRRGLIPGENERYGVSPMSRRACTIAVSEMAGVPVEQICNYALVTWSHTADPAAHEIGILPGGGDWRLTERLLKTALADLESS